METLFSPAPQDVERYRRLRTLSAALSQKIADTIPRRAFDEIGEAIGVLQNGVPVSGIENMNNVMADCCLYEWVENGKNLVQQYAEAHPATPGTDESYLLNAYLQSKYRLLGLQSAVPDAGLYCDDILTGERLFLMDLAFSRSAGNCDVVFATRTIPLGEYWMTTAAGLPIDKNTARQVLLRTVRGHHRLLERTGSIALSIVRACLEAGIAGHVAHQTVEAKSKKPLREPRWPGSKRRPRPAR